MAWDQESFAFDILATFAEAQGLAGNGDIIANAVSKRALTKREYDAVWKALNPALVREARRRWVANNAEKRAEQDRRRRLRRHGKECGKCHDLLPKSKFSAKRARNWINRQGVCEDCLAHMRRVAIKAAQDKWSLKNRERLREAWHQKYSPEAKRRTMGDGQRKTEAA